MAARTTDWASPLGTFVVYVFDDDDNLRFVSRTSSSNTWGEREVVVRDKVAVDGDAVMLEGKSLSSAAATEAVAAGCRRCCGRARSASITDRWLSDGGYDGGGP